MPLGQLDDYVAIPYLLPEFTMPSLPAHCSFNVVGGLDSSGKGAVFTYDAVGSFERVGYAAQGAGQKLIIPLLDDIVGGRNRADTLPPLTVEAAVETVKEAFVTAGERDIYTGDTVEIFIITKDGVREERFELKKD